MTATNIEDEVSIPVTTLQIHELTKTHEGCSPVDKVSLDLFKGETCVVLGYSGAGKSTLIDMLVGKT